MHAPPPETRTRVTHAAARAASHEDLTPQIIIIVRNAALSDNFENKRHICIYIIEKKKKNSRSLHLSSAWRVTVFPFRVRDGKKNQNLTI